MTPAHRNAERRWPVLVVVALVVAAGAAFAAARGTPAPAGQSGSPASLVSAPDAESSAWYCTPQSTASGGGGAVGGPLLTNTTTRSVSASIRVVSEKGARAHVSVPVPPDSVVAPALPVPSSGSWQAATVTLSGGGVAVSQMVHGPTGWSEAPCQSTTSSRWYFPGGTTSKNDGLYLSLLNPTSTPVVVDLTFVTPTGTVHPINYQGIVVQPGQLQVEDVSAEVQESTTVSTVVAVRTGRVVASQVQQFAGSSQGLSIVPGEPAPQTHWSIPQAEEVPGGTSEIDVFNPGSTSEKVTVDFRLSSGPSAPLRQTVAPGTNWAISSSAQTRLPANATYSAEVVATGGPGVVVGRTMVLPATAAAPQAGMAVAVSGLSSRSPSATWVVPPPGTASSPAVPGAAPSSLAISNTSADTASYTAGAESPQGQHVVDKGTLAPGETVFISGPPLAGAGLDPIVVHADAPLAVTENVGPSGGLGVVTMPGLPLASAIGL